MKNLKQGIIWIVVLFPAFFIINFIIFIPLGFLNHIFDIMNNSHATKTSKIFKSLIWIILGLPFMILVFFINDIYLFCVSCSMEVIIKLIIIIYKL